MASATEGLCVQVRFGDGEWRDVTEPVSQVLVGAAMEPGRMEHKPDGRVSFVFKPRRGPRLAWALLTRAVPGHYATARRCGGARLVSLVFALRLAAVGWRWKR